MSNQRVPQQNINPINALAAHYHLLQQQLIKQRQEKYNKICQGLFAPRVKRRKGLFPNPVFKSMI
jgi:hypothetical protein